MSISSSHHVPLGGDRTLIGIALALCVLAVAWACSDSPTEPPVAPVDQPILYVHNGEVRVIADTGGVSTPLMDDPNLQARYAVWSPRGTHVLLWAQEEDGSRTLHVMEADGSNRIRVSDIPDQVDGWGDWSPDGQRVVFRSNRSELYVVDRDGSGQVELTPGDHGGIDPHWSPDGEWIVYQGSDVAGSGIDRVRPDGTGHERLHDVGWDAQRAPRYAPDGSRIAFVDGQDLHLIDSDGSNARPLTLTPSTGDWHPRWSPDGTLIAYHVDAGVSWGVGVIDVGTGFMVDTLRASQDALYPSWAPDGSRLTFQIQNTVIVGSPDAADDWEALTPGRYPDWHPGG